MASYTKDSGNEISRSTKIAKCVSEMHFDDVKNADK